MLTRRVVTVRMEKKHTILIVLVTALVVGVLVFSITSHIDKKIISRYKMDLYARNREIANLKMSIYKLRETLKLQDFEVYTWEATAYAPLDPEAEDGVCYSGDPQVTASGELIEPGISVAAPPSVPFGTWLWIEDLGWRRVDDRGGAIKEGHIDISMTTKREALEFGRKKVHVIIPKKAR